MKYCFAILLFLFITNVNSQNLIYNGDFEIYDTCPTNASSPPNDYYIKNCLGWGTPTIATSDFFHSCNSTINGFVSTPGNPMGYQIPYNGEGYLGFGMYTEYIPSTDWFEYVQGTLIQPLQQGKEYELSFYLSLAESGSWYSLENIGFIFTEDSLFFNNSQLLPYVPDYVWEIGNLSDTINWMEIKGRFVASGGEKYVSIGYFPQGIAFEDSLSLYGDATDSEYIAYYFIDGVSLVEVVCTNDCELLLPNVITPNGDGQNDFIQFDSEGVTDFEFRIYNRWGVEVYSTIDPEKKFEGVSANGLKLSEGIYFGILSAKKFGKVIKQQQYIHVLY
ncbi:MAG: gliding motility-associated C-terminal domain-containing protein [Crocinitomicaceae bacterium]